MCSIAADRDTGPLKAKVEPSVVYMEYFVAGKDGQLPELKSFGTGFVISDPKGEKWILTSAHSLQPTSDKRKVIDVKYRLINQQRPASCGSVIVDQEHDLAVFAPHNQYPLNVPTLTLLSAGKQIPTPLFALGTAFALDLQLEDGKYAAEVLTVSEWAKKLHRNVADFSPFAGDLSLVRHNITAPHGYSGCPIFTANAEVVGVQSSRLKDDSNIGFAVHFKHIRDFNWSKAPVSLNAINLADYSAGKLLAWTSTPPLSFKAETSSEAARSQTFPLRIKLGGVEVDAPLIHHGYVERDALTVIDKYIEDKGWYFTEQLGGIRLLRLQELLDRTRLARISNPLLGIHMLVPEGYRYSACPTMNPDGMLVTFSPPENRKVKLPYNLPVSLWVTVEPEHFRTGRQEFARHVASGRIKLSPAEIEYPSLLASFRDKWIRAAVTDIVGPRFASRDLKIRVEESKGTLTQKAPNVLQAETFQQVIYGDGPWLRNNYLSDTSSRAHLVRVGTREPLILVVHSQFSKEDSAAFNRLDRECDITDMEFAILTSSVSAR